jgi:hypothetical protein
MVFPQWKVVLEVHLQSKGVDVWCVTNISRGMKNESKKERQWDVITKSTLLSSLYDSVFNRGFSCKNPNNFGSLPVRTMEEKRCGKMKVTCYH